MSNTKPTNGSRRTAWTGLWSTLLPPAAWGLHFLAVYVATALYCEKAPEATLLPLRAVVIVLTLAALAAQGFAATRAIALLRRSLREDKSDPEARFLGATAIALAALAVLATLAVAAVFLFFGDCRR